MTYNPLIPILTNNVTTDASQIQVNFLQLNTLYGSDHFALDSTVAAASRGLHKQISFPAVSAADPALAGNVGYIFLKNDTNDTSLRPQPYFKNNTTTYQLNNRFVSAVANGYCQLPGGVIIMWGTEPCPTSSAGQNIPFNTIANYTGAPAGFPNNIFSVQFTIQTPSSGNIPGICLSNSAPPTKNSFTIRVNSSVANTSINWFAVGN